MPRSSPGTSEEDAGSLLNARGFFEAAAGDPNCEASDREVLMGPPGGVVHGICKRLALLVC